MVLKCNFGFKTYKKKKLKCLSLPPPERLGRMAWRKDGEAPPHALREAKNNKNKSKSTLYGGGEGGNSDSSRPNARGNGAEP